MLIASSGGMVIDTFLLDKKSCYAATEEKTFDASIHRLVLDKECPLRKYVQEFGAIRPRVNFSLMAIDSQSVDEVTGFISQPLRNLPTNKAIKRGRVSHFETTTLMAGSQSIGAWYDGVLESVNNGVVRGWVVEKLPANPYRMFNWDIPVSIYLNGWYAGETTHTYQRKDLAMERLKRHENGKVVQLKENGYGFDFPLPLNFFKNNGVNDFSLELRVARRNIVLRRSPCLWTGENARWNAETKEWESSLVSNVRKTLAQA